MLRITHSIRALAAITLASAAFSAQAADYQVTYKVAGLKPTPSRPLASCNAILNAGQSTGDGIYTIEPTPGQPMSVYCDMTFDGGGWTQVMGPKAPVNLLDLQNYQNGSVASVSPSSISINQVQCTGSTTIGGGGTIAGIVGNIPHSQANLSLSWNGRGVSTGNSDYCEGTNGDGIFLGSTLLTRSSSTATKNFSSLSDLRFSCKCNSGNFQSGTATGRVMVR